MPYYFCNPPCTNMLGGPLFRNMAHPFTDNRYNLLGTMNPNEGNVATR